MYDENQIEDSLEFIRQIKDFYPDESGTGSNKKEDLTKELFENMTLAMQDIGGKKPWESVLSEVTKGQGKKADATKKASDFETDTSKRRESDFKPPEQEKAGQQDATPQPHEIKTPEIKQSEQELSKDFDFEIPQMSNTSSAAALRQALEELKQIKDNRGKTIASDEQEANISDIQTTDGNTLADAGTKAGISAEDAKRALNKRRESIEEERAAKAAESEVSAESGLTDEDNAVTSEDVDAIFEKELKKNKNSENEFFRNRRKDKKSREKIRKNSVSEPQKNFIDNIKEQKEDFIYKIAGRKSANDMLITDADGNKRVISNRNSLKIVSNVLIVVMCIFIAFSLASLVTNYVAHQTTVEGESMSPALANNDSLIIQKISYYLGDPKRYDVVVFPVAYDTETKEQTYFVKRVIGLPNETVQIIEGKVYIDGKMLPDDSYAEEDILDPGLAAQPITLGDDEYFVLGDNRNTSTDSRSSYVGMVSRNNIVGKAWFCIWPLTHIGGVK